MTFIGTPTGAAPTVQGVSPEPRVWRIRFDWPKPPLSNNDRHHWAVKAGIKSAIRDEVKIRVRAAKVPNLPFCELRLIWHVGTRHHRDPINLTDLFKTMQDALTRSGKGATAGILPDDTPEYVDTLMPTIVYGKGMKPYFEMEIRA